MKKEGPQRELAPCRETTGFIFQIKKLCWASDKNSVCVVYEDMSYSRRNTVSTPNPYQ